MTGHAMLQRAPATQAEDVTQATGAGRYAGGKLTQLAIALNARPAVQALGALSNNLSAPLQAKFKIRGGKEYDDGDQVRSASALKTYLKGNHKADEIIDEIAEMASDGKDMGEVSWREVIELAESYIGDTDDEEAVPDFSGFNPTKLDDKDTPTDEQLFKLNRRGSIDFSDKFEGAFGFSTGDARKKTIKATTKKTSNDYTTRGPGRFMSLSQSQLGETVYKSFLPKLPGQIGMDETETAEILLSSLLDYPKFTEKTKLMSSTSKRALEQTSMLFHNEIIHRSSSNLPAITGVLQDVVSGDTPSIAQGLELSAMFLPTAKNSKSKTGGQQLSRFHHVDSTASKKFKAGKVEPELVTLKNSYKKSLGATAKKKGRKFDDLHEDVSVLNKRYIDNLQSHVDLSEQPRKKVKRDDDD